MGECYSGRQATLEVKATVNTDRYPQRNLTTGGWSTDNTHKYLKILDINESCCGEVATVGKIQVWRNAIINNCCCVFENFYL